EPGGRNGVDAGRMREGLHLGDEGRGDVLGEHVARMQSAMRREEGREPLRGQRVHEAVDAALGDAGELGEADPQRVEDEAQHLTVEVAAAQQDRKSTRLNSSHEWISYA